MGKTIAEKILSKKLGRDVSAGEFIVADLDFVGLHDASGPLAVRLFKEKGWTKVFNPKKCCFAPSLGPAREISNDHTLIRNFAREQGCH